MSIPSGLVRDQDTGRLVPASAEDLELMYKLNMANIKESVDARNTSVEETVRVIVVVIGMILMVYGLLLVLAFFFDRFNTVIDISLLGVFTIGKMNHTAIAPTTSGAIARLCWLTRIPTSQWKRQRQYTRFPPGKMR